MAYNVLMMGASYGSLLAIKLLFGGHKITMVCLPNEVEAFNSDGAHVRMPIRGRVTPVDLDSRKLPGSLKAAGTGDVNPADYDLVVLGMQEPQYRSPGVRELLDAAARAKVPCMSIMNMPPPPYLARIPGLAMEPLRAAVKHLASTLRPALISTSTNPCRTMACSRRSVAPTGWTAKTRISATSSTTRTCSRSW